MESNRNKPALSNDSKNGARQATVSKAGTESSLTAPRSGEARHNTASKKAPRLSGFASLFSRAVWLRTSSRPLVRAWSTDDAVMHHAVVVDGVDFKNDATYFIKHD